MKFTLKNRLANKLENQWLGLVARLALGAVLFLAGWLKAFKFDEAQMAVRAYEVLPISVANVDRKSTRLNSSHT